MTAPPASSAPPDSNFADFQNEALLGSDQRSGPSAGSSKTEAHESAAHEKRNWVRLSYDCNNHCTFCLDSNAHDGTMRANMDIKVQIIEGRKKGATRLILSGGEPTMHPNFLDFVKLGKRAGYPKVQTVTNGRMFNYPEFLETAAKNGLDEITFSLHGHTAKLHDALVGTPGAFVEETGGLKAALADGRFIINIDIVINKQNIKHLPDMLELFISWGVREFDLLHIIPFGNAWSDAREHLFYDLDGNLEYLQKTFAFARLPNMHIWLNRFPPPYTEGFEDLIQDPYKLNDEVRGRREEYDRYLSLGKKLDCRQPERCKYCYLQNLCDTLDTVIDARTEERVEVLRVEGTPPAAERLPTADKARVVAKDLTEARALLRTVGPAVIDLDLASYEGLAEALGAGAEFDSKRVDRCYARDTTSLAGLLTIAPIGIAILLTKETAPAVRQLVREGAEELPRIWLVQPNYDRVSDAIAHDIDLVSLLGEVPAAVRVENVPACLAGREVEPAPLTLDTAMLGPDARIDMARFTQRYVADGYYTKALRCGTCSENDRCRGVHVNWVRAHGFASLTPLRLAR